MGEALRKMSTIEDINNLPEGERAELIDGRLFMMAAPNRRHQRIVAGVSFAIYSHIRERGGDCEVNFAPFAVFLFGDDSVYVEPDVCVVCDRRKLDERGCSGAPDWMLEVLSPGSRSLDYLVKMRKYEQAGVREYWIIDPEREVVDVYCFEHENVERYTFRDQIPSGVCEGLIIDFAALDIM